MILHARINFKQNVCVGKGKKKEEPTTLHCFEKSKHGMTEKRNFKSDFLAFLVLRAGKRAQTFGKHGTFFIS